jgi:hypothetical protein
MHDQTLTVRYFYERLGHKCLTFPEKAGWAEVLMYVNTKINSTAHNERQSLNLVNNVFFLSIIIVGVSAVRTERLFGKA